ncbi:hypothetical protein TTHERM_00190990 (macronuclear) [Tetrahymena thermophila SB210]|uniref:Uncharacterized protein n=1 Tax=Tetrahymena thermophila (strain SB210) TaxID=312017 RepID=I7LV09_TETTS|nr:hypothetical protein TTHERM_00190990 [Tetrahymena thermophila SB210]EAR96431.2 hypothetical protein TTHERM_00190990 [Tetrahymena thermophila SB210]|eukprot:XP_001016676.2 hypothetical protein TTHERM_00190990 [Tetrahymena thermophila SB210]
MSSLKHKQITKRQAKKSSKQKNEDVIAVLKKELFQSERIFFIEGDLIVNLDFIQGVDCQQIKFDEVSPFRPFISSVWDKKNNYYMFYRDPRCPKSQLEKLYHILDSLGNQYAHNVCLELKKYFEVMQDQLQKYKQKNHKIQSEYNKEKTFQLAQKYLNEKVKSKYFAFMVRTGQGYFLHNELVGISQNLINILGFKPDEFEHLVLTQGVPMFYNKSMFSSQKLISDLKIKQILYDQDKLDFMEDIQTDFQTADNQFLNVRLKGKRVILQERPNNFPDDLIIIEGEYDFDQIIRYLLLRNKKQQSAEIQEYMTKVDNFLIKYYKKENQDSSENSKFDHLRCKYRPLNEHELQRLKDIKEQTDINLEDFAEFEEQLDFGFENHINGNGQQQFQDQDFFTNQEEILNEYKNQNNPTSIDEQTYCNEGHQYLNFDINSQQMITQNNINIFQSNQNIFQQPCQKQQMQNSNINYSNQLNFSNEFDVIERNCSDEMNIEGGHFYFNLSNDQVDQNQGFHFQNENEQSNLGYSQNLQFDHAQQQYKYLAYQSVLPNQHSEGYFMQQQSFKLPSNNEWIQNY